MVQRRRSSSEDRPSSVRFGRSSASTSTAGEAPHIGSVRVTRIDHQQHQTLTAPSAAASLRSRSPSTYQSFSGSVTDVSHLPVDHPRLYKPRSLSDITAARDTLTSPRSRAGSHDAYVVGYATVTTQERPPGSAGVNYKVFLNQVPTASSPAYLTNELITSKPIKPRFDHSAYSSYKSTPTPTYYTAANYSATTSPVSTYPSVSSYSSVSRRSRAPQRSASLPRLHTSSTTSPRSYAVAPSSVALRMMASDGPATVDTWTPWRSPRSVAKRRDDEDEFYRRLREIRVRAASPIADDLDVVRRGTSRGRTIARPAQSFSPNVIYTGKRVDHGLIPDRPVSLPPALSFSPNVIYTGKKIDHGLIPERPMPPPMPQSLSSYSTFVDDNPSRYHEFEPTDVGVVVLPNGQRAITYTRQSQTGHGDHREANVEIEKIIRKTKYLQDSMHTLEEFVRRNRSLFPEDIIIYQNVKFFRLNEEELRRIGERPDAEVYGVKIREKLVVPYGTEVIDILRKHYSKHREVEIEYDDLEHIRHLAASAEKTQLSTKDSIRRVVETEYDEMDRMKAVPPRAPVVPTADYRMLTTLDALNVLPVRAPEVDGVTTETRRHTLRTLTEGRQMDTGDLGRPALEFTSKLRNRHITEGNSVRLSCALNVTPDTVVTWYHGNNIVRQSDNHHLSVRFYLDLFITAAPGVTGCKRGGASDLRSRGRGFDSKSAA